MATSPFGGFANLSRYQQAAAQPNQNPLDALIGGFQQGVQLQNLPQQLQSDALNQQLQQAIAQAKLQELQGGKIYQLGNNLVKKDPVTGEYISLFSSPSTSTPLRPQIDFGSGLGIIPTNNPQQPFEAVQIPVRGGGNLEGRISQKQAADLATAQARFDNSLQTEKDRQDFQSEQARINREFLAQENAKYKPTSDERSTLADIKANSKKEASNAALSEKLAKDVQSNKAYQAFRTVNDATEGLQATLEYANTNPTDQTGIKSSAVDAFNKIINPNSVVRQQAFAQTTSGQSLINKIENFANGLGTGQTITPAQIQTMLDLAKKYQEGARKSAQAELTVIKRRGDKAEIDPEDYIPGIFNVPRGTISSAPVQINTKAEKDALAPGTRYIGPDGLIATTPKRP